MGVYLQNNINIYVYFLINRKKPPTIYYNRDRTFPSASYFTLHINVAFRVLF